MKKLGNKIYENKIYKNLNLSELSDKIFYTRKNKRLTRKKLTEPLKLSEMTLLSFEKKQRDIMIISFLKIAQALNLGIRITKIKDQ